MKRGVTLFILACVWPAFLAWPGKASSREINTLNAPVNLAGAWKFQAGDNAAWADPNLDDSAWNSVEIPGAWELKATENASGFAWYRLEVRLPGTGTASRRPTELALLFGPVACGSYEVFAGGTRIGGVGSGPPAPDVWFPRPNVFVIPTDAPSSDGRLTVAVRMWFEPRYVSTFRRFGAPPSGACFIGSSETLAERAELWNHRERFDNLSYLILPILFVLVGLYHIQVYSRRRQLIEYLWFGLFSIFFAYPNFLLSVWGRYALPISWAAVSTRIVSHFSIVCCIRFLYSFFKWPMGRWARLFLVLQLVLAGLTLFESGLALGRLGGVIYLVVVLPLVILGPTLVFREAWRGNPDARVIGLGGIAVGVTLAVFIGSMWGLVAAPPITHFGFALLLLSMTASLSNRFSRVHNELDALNRDLEHKVEERTSKLSALVDEIESSRQDLESKNNRLRQSEETFSKLFHLNPIPSSTLSLTDGRVLDANEAALKMVGFTREEIVGRTTTELDMWVDLDARARMYEDLAAGRTPCIFDTQFRTKTGRIVDVSVSVEVVEVAGEKHILGMYHDITDRKIFEAELQETITELGRKNEELRQTEEKFSKFFQANPIPSMLLSLPEGNFLDVNEAGLRLTGYDRDEVIGRTSPELNPATDMEQRRKLYEALKEGRTPFTYETVVRTKLGELKNAFISVELISLNGKSCILGMVLDITERKRLEEQLQNKVAELNSANRQLRQSEEKFATFFRTNPVPSAFISLARRRIVDVNASFIKTLGYSREEMVGRTSEELNVWVDPEVRREVYEAVAQRNTPYTIESQVRAKSGDVLDVIGAFDVIETGNEVALIGMFYDITKRKQLESQLHKKLHELARKNEELEASHKQADRIFSALAEALPGTVLDGKYRLEEKIGTGGFGAVFRATHLGLNHSVAVKVFRPAPGRDSAEDVERFRREGVSACRVQHPNAIAVLDSNISTEGIAYLVMELLVGHTLAHELHRQKRIPLPRCVKIVGSVCAALAQAHSVGIIHRDIKPDNIFMHRDKDGETVKLVDFGIAKLSGDHADAQMHNLTATGSIIGTPTYMAPECLRGERFDIRADIYSVGVTMYEMLCGRAPFMATTKGGLIAVMLRQIKEDPPPVREFNPSISERVEAVVMSALSKDPEERPTATELAERFAEAVVESLNVQQAGTQRLDGVPLPDFETDERGGIHTAIRTLVRRTTDKSVPAGTPPSVEMLPPTIAVDDETISPTLIAPPTLDANQDVVPTIIVNSEADAEILIPTTIEQAVRDDKENDE